MPANTPILALPYPVPADTVDVPRDVKALADRLDTFSSGIFLPVVAALPGAPADGAECLFIADNAKGILWHLRYSAATAGGYKWHFVGGPPLHASVGGVESTASTVSVELATPLFLTLPLKGIYSVRGIVAASWSNAVGQTLLNFELYFNGTIGLAATNNMPGQNLTGNQQFELSDLDIPNANTDVRTKYKTAAGTGFWQMRSLVATPTRVG